MKQIEKYGAQGELDFVRMDALPKDAVVQKRDGAIIVGHSETGHHHVITDEDVQFFVGGDPLVCYLRCEGVAHVEHQRPHDTHETLALLGGTKSDPAFYAIVHQREWTPEGARRAED